ncbi:hypothetical protein E2C01_005694 [Portunus trituberculatus]|uniref:Uncharacterized protein n=1 Tax=Portunus trituberculatus TaxID=210409 RepID=A0A5B7CXA5_PORTR|nr:hypothetical protein [Portunus trituberculatus]
MVSPDYVLFSDQPKHLILVPSNLLPGMGVMLVVVVVVVAGRVGGSEPCSTTTCEVGWVWPSRRCATTASSFTSSCTTMTTSKETSLLSVASLEGPSSSLKVSNPDWSKCAFAIALSMSSVTTSTLKMHCFTMSSRLIFRKAFPTVFPEAWILTRDDSVPVILKAASSLQSIIFHCSSLQTSLHPKPEHDNCLLRSIVWVLGLDDVDVRVSDFQLVCKSHPVRTQHVRDVSEAKICPVDGTNSPYKKKTRNLGSCNKIPGKN